MVNSLPMHRILVKALRVYQSRPSYREAEEFDPVSKPTEKANLYLHCWFVPLEHDSMKRLVAFPPQILYFTDIVNRNLPTQRCTEMSERSVVFIDKLIQVKCEKFVSDLEKYQGIHQVSVSEWFNLLNGPFGN